MNLSNSDTQVSEIVQVDCVDRWSVYYRLQELSIPCWCESGKPLLVRIDSVAASIQLWSVLKQVTGSRQEWLDWLEWCWRA